METLLQPGDRVKLFNEEWGEVMSGRHMVKSMFGDYAIYSVRFPVEGVGECDFPIDETAIVEVWREGFQVYPPENIQPPLF
jgi:hypothetical protein